MFAIDAQNLHKVSIIKLNSQACTELSTKINIHSETSMADIALKKKDKSIYSYKRRKSSHAKQKPDFILFIVL